MTCYFYDVDFFRCVYLGGPLAAVQQLHEAPQQRGDALRHRLPPVDVVAVEDVRREQAAQQFLAEEVPAVLHARAQVLQGGQAQAEVAPGKLHDGVAQERQVACYAIVAAYGDGSDVRLNNGVMMPAIGFGVYQIPADETERAVGDAVETDYIDLLLIHQPLGDYYGTYRAMEKACEAGKARAIGLSNFYDARFVDLAENMDIKPAVVQLETHVFSQQVKMRHLAEKYGTHIMAWSPLARGMNGLFTNKTLKAIGEKYGKDNAQVCLKFLTDEGIIVLPQSTRTERMASNLAIDDFSLGETDKELIRKMDTGKALAADFNDPELAGYLLAYDRNFNPRNK